MNKKILKILIICLLIGIVIYLIYFLVFYKINKRKRNLELQLNMINKEIQYIQKENLDLKEGVFDSSKYEYLEKEARLNLGYKKQGETAVILSGTTTTKNQNSSGGKSLFEKIQA